MNTNQSRFVFVSYSRQDSEIVQRLSADLKTRSVEVWFDKVGLKPGTRNWEQALRDAISHAYAIVLVASPKSRQSVYVQDEIAIAKMYERPIFPVWVDGEEWMESIPIGMGLLQNVDARGENYENAIVTLADELSHVQEYTTQVIEALYVEEDKELPPNFVPRNPYKGLRAFRAEDRNDFFGRDRVIQELLDIIEQQDDERLLPVIGPSGSGKSSVIMAGLLPRLQEGILPESDRWVYLPPVVPGTHPLENLAVALKTVLGGSSITSLREDLNDPGSRGLHRLAQQISAQHESRPVILYIDQFEEIFTLVDDLDVRHQYIQILVTAATEARGAMHIIISMRADFYDRPMHYAELGRLIEKHGKAMLPMTIAELQESIQLPAQRPDVRIKFEERLVAELVFEIRDTIGGLPLLQFALDELFERRENLQLTMRAYRELGGVRGALAQHAEDTYQTLDSEEEKELARALLLRLIEPGVTELDTTRRRADMAELTLSTEKQTAQMREVAEVFINARLLVTDHTSQGTTIEVSHEALIREWKRLAGWLDEARSDVNLQQEISADVVEWIARDRPADRLYTGSQLHEALEWAERNTPSFNEMDFITLAKQQAERRARNRRMMFVGSFVALMIVIVALIAGVRTLNASVRTRNQSIGEAFPVISVDRFERGNIPTSLFYANAALAALDTPEGQIALINALTAPYLDIDSPYDLTEGTQYVRFIDSNEDGTLFVTISPLESEEVCTTQDICLSQLQLWDRNGNSLNDAIENDVYVPQIYWNEDETHFVTVSNSANNIVDCAADCRFTARIWNTEGEAVGQVIEREIPIGQIHWNETGSQIIVVSISQLVNECFEDCQTSISIYNLDGELQDEVALNAIPESPVVWNEQKTHFILSTRSSVVCDVDCEFTLLLWDVENNQYFLETTEVHPGADNWVGTYFAWSESGEQVNFVQYTQTTNAYYENVVVIMDTQGNTWRLDAETADTQLFVSDFFADDLIISNSPASCTFDDCGATVTLLYDEDTAIPLDFDLPVVNAIWTEDSSKFVTISYVSGGYTCDSEEDCEYEIVIWNAEGERLNAQDIHAEEKVLGVYWLDEDNKVLIVTSPTIDCLRSACSVRAETWIVNESNAVFDDSQEIEIDYRGESSLLLYSGGLNQSKNYVLIGSQPRFYDPEGRSIGFAIDVETLTMLSISEELAQTRSLSWLREDDYILLEEQAAEDCQTECFASSTLMGLVDDNLVTITSGNNLYIVIDPEDESNQIFSYNESGILAVWNRDDLEIFDPLVHDIDDLTIILSMPESDQFEPEPPILWVASGDPVLMLDHDFTQSHERIYDYAWSDPEQTYLGLVIARANNPFDPIAYRLVVWDIAEAQIIMDRQLIGAFQVTWDWAWSDDGESIIFGAEGLEFGSDRNDIVVHVPLDLGILKEEGVAQYQNHLQQYDESQ